MSVQGETVICYSQRMLNPFHGMMSVLETPHADAVSRDGVHWTLFVHWESADVQEGVAVDSPDIRFGSWSAREGLKRAPVRSTTDYARLQYEGERLVHALETHTAQVPFPSRDRYELWLLDGRENLPLALLGSACREEETRQSPPDRWNAGQRARSFFQQGRTPMLVEQLTQEVHVAGRCMAMQWFLREADGTGEGRDGFRLPPGAEGRSLPAECFPELPLREVWEEGGMQARVDAYHAWQAPWLLGLQGLGDATRARLEQAAAHQALWVEEQHRLYPKVLDRDRLNAVLVEAGLRRAAGEVAEQPVELPLFSFGATGN